MKKINFAIVSCLLAAALLVPACSRPQAAAQPVVGEAPVQPAAVLPEKTEALAAPADGPVIAPVAATETPITHKTLPGMPAYQQQLPGECNTGFNYQPVGYQVRPPCDIWHTSLFERAVSADMGTFYHYLDILSAQIGKEGDWYYASLDLFGAGVPADGVPLTYFFELDLNQDGRGDVLLAVENLDLYATEWTVSGMRAWRDLNGDVGGETPIRPDSQGGDGYETLVFDQGLGDDPDLAWARRDPNHYQRIEFAFKPALLSGNGSFMWWGGAMRGNFDPAVFDLVDANTEKMLYEIDTTCGWIFGHEKAYNVRKCYIAPNPTPKPKEDICIKPPHPDPQNNCWIWFPDKCKWDCWN
jgi:hypothetical protein